MGKLEKSQLLSVFFRRSGRSSSVASVAVAIVLPRLWISLSLPSQFFTTKSIVVASAYKLTTEYVGYSQFTTSSIVGGLAGKQDPRFMLQIRQTQLASSSEQDNRTHACRQLDSQRSLTQLRKGINYSKWI